MALTILLAKVIGIVLVMIGAAIMFRRHYFLPVFAAYVEQRLVRTTMSMIELLAGVFLVVAHNVWSPLPAALITILGWMAVLEATIGDTMRPWEEALAAFLPSTSRPAS